MNRIRRVSLGVIALLAAAVLPAFASASVTFDRTQTTAGSRPEGVAVGDVNADGKADAVTANLLANNMSVLLGNGVGGFTPAAGSPASAGTFPTAVALGDVNADGKLDAVVANNGSSNMSVLLGNGSGGFAAAAGSPVTVGTNPGSVALADVNADGKLDAVVANVGSDNVSVLLGNGSGGFAAAAGSPVSAGDNPISVILADVNANGRLDVLVANNLSDNVSVLLGDGSGGFAAAAGSPIAVGDGPLSLVSRDVNADGRLDAVVAAADLRVLLGNGSGGFAAAGSPIAISNSTQGALALADVNADAKPDVLVGHSSNVSVLLGNGSGGFAAAGSPIAVGFAYEVTAGDVNADGRTDVLVTTDPSTVVALLNTSQPVSSVSPSSLTFASRNVDTQSGAKSVRLTNTGDAKLTISSVRFTGLDAEHFRKIDDDCKGETLMVGESCRVLVAFAPLSWGLLNGTSLQIGSNAPTSPQKVTLSGTATPETTITAGPAHGGSTTDRTPTLAFASDDTNPGVSFECKVDAGAFAACTSPFTTAKLTRGVIHVVKVQAKDADGPVLDPTPAKRKFTVN